MKKVPYPITDLTGGINVAKDPLYLTDKESVNIVCARMYKGIVKKDLGWQVFGLPLLGVPMLIDTFYKSDGIYRTLCFTTTSAYRYDATLLEWVDITYGVEVCNCEDAWTASANVTSTADTTLYKRGSKSAKHVIAAEFTTGLASYRNFSAKDLTGWDQIHLLVRSSIALNAGDIQLLLDDTSACASPIETINFPALAANTWTRVSLAIATPASCGAIVSVGLKVAVDRGACTIYLDDIRAVLESTGGVTDAYSTVPFMDTYIVTNYVDAMKKYTATNDYLELLAGSPPKCRSVTAFMNRLVCCYTYEDAASHPFRIKWSDPGTIETWPAENYLEASDSPDWCVALKVIGAKCVLFKEQSIWDVTYIGGTVVFQLAAKINQIGTMAPSTIDRIREELVFFSYAGIHKYDQSQVTSLSSSIFPLLFQTGEKLVNLAAVRSFCASYVEELQEYWLSVCEGHSTTPSLLLKYNIETGSWVKRVDKPITCIGFYERVGGALTWDADTEAWDNDPASWDASGLPGDAATVLLGYNTGQIYEDNAFTVTTDEFLWETKDYMFKHATRVVECRVAAKYGGYTIYYSLDGGLSWVEGTTFAFAVDWVEHVYYLNVTTQRIRFRIRTTQPTLEIRWLEPWYIERQRSKTLTTA